MQTFRYTSSVTSVPVTFIIVKMKAAHSYAIYNDRQLLLCIIEYKDGQWQRFGRHFIAAALLEDLCHFIGNNPDLN